MLSHEVLSHVPAILFFAILAIFVHRFAAKRGFLSLPEPNTHPFPPVSPLQLGLIFAIYVGILFFSIKALGHLTPAARSGMQLLAMSSAAITLFIFCSLYAPLLLKNLFSSRPFWHPMRIGAAFWLLSFPTVMVVGQICELIITATFGPKPHEQVAVDLLKHASGSPSALAAALIAILIAAPLLEEFLFRGTLQNFLKRYLPTKWAIALSALGFALLHLSPSQGVGNIALGASIFTFGCYLGFVYEKVGSLYACVGLHMTFNLISSLRILS